MVHSKGCTFSHKYFIKKGGEITLKRLIRKSDKIKQEIITPEIPLVDKDTIKNLKEDVINDIKNINTSNMVLLNELDEADIRHNKLFTPRNF